MGCVGMLCQCGNAGAAGGGGFIEIGWSGKPVRAVSYADPAWRALEAEEPNPMPAVIGSVIDSLESGGEPVLSAAKALRATEVIFAIYESSRRRARIDLPLEPKDSALLTMLEEGVIGPGA